MKFLILHCIIYVETLLTDQNMFCLYSSRLKNINGSIHMWWSVDILYLIVLVQVRSDSCLLAWFTIS